MNGNSYLEQTTTDDGAALQINLKSAYLEDSCVLRNVAMQVEPKSILALVGPSSEGKYIFLKILNRMHQHTPNFRMEGEIKLGNKNIEEIPTEKLRQAIAMVFSTPNPFPISIYENLAFGLRLSGVRDKEILDLSIRKALQSVDLWEELRKKLSITALQLGTEYRQRLCLARSLTLQPKVILMDKPTFHLGSSAKARFEELLLRLQNHHTIIIVTEDRQQAGRISSHTAFFYKGRLVEYSDTYSFFTQPKELLTENYITGRLK